MKLKVIQLVIFLIFNVGWSQGNNSALVVYKVVFNQSKESLVPTPVSKAVIKANDIIKNAEDVLATLTFNQMKSKYMVNKTLHQDNKSINITEFFAGGEDVFYSDLSQKKLFKKTSSLGDTFLVNYPSIDWIITGDKKLINNFLCYRAYRRINPSSSIKQSSAEAWFCPEIPANFGPLYYNGLPGLILELRLLNTTFFVKEIRWLETPSIVQFPTNIKEVSLEDYKNMVMEANPSFFKQN